MDFDVTADHRVKLKEGEKRNKYLGFARGLKKTMEHESDGDPNYNGALSAVNKGLVQGLEIREQVETIQITVLLRSARILRRVLETWGGLPSLRPQ